MYAIDKVALVVFRDKKVLLTRHAKEPEVFFTLGGKRRGSETDLECLKREVWEEVGCGIREGSATFLEEFVAPAHGHPHMNVHIRLYGGELAGEPRPSSEIVEIRYFDSTADPKYFTETLRDFIMPWLKERGFVE